MWIIISLVNVIIYIISRIYSHRPSFCIRYKLNIGTDSAYAFLMSDFIGADSNGSL